MSYRILQRVRPNKFSMLTRKQNALAITTKHVTQLDTHTQTRYILGQHDSNINIKTVQTATTQSDFIRTVTTK